MSIPKRHGRVGHRIESRSYTELDLQAFDTEDGTTASPDHRRSAGNGGRC